MSEDLMMRAYKASEAMEPIAALDWYVKIIQYQKPPLYRQVDFYERIPFFQCIDLVVATGVANLALQTATAKTNIVNLELQEDEFGQWRWFPLDNMQVTLFVPSGVSKWHLRNIDVGIDRSIIYRDPLLISTEINTWEDERPAIIGTNFSDYALNAARIIATGYRFHTISVSDAIVSKIKAGTVPCKPIICGGMS